MTKFYDVIIVGAGAAGLSAALYTTRRAMTTLVISKDLGGQAALTSSIENYPGIETIDGYELMERFKKQAEKFGAEYFFDGVEILELLSSFDRVQSRGEKLPLTPEEKTVSEKAIQELEHIFYLETANGTAFIAKVVILAFGLTPRNLDVPGEKKFSGRGVSYCATCDAPLFKGKEVVVVGGGNSALDAAESLSKLSPRVFLIHRRDSFRGEAVLIERVKTLSNVEIIFDSVVTEVLGETIVEGVAVEHLETQKKRTVPCGGVFVEIGHVAKTDWVAHLVDREHERLIVINNHGETKTPGLFAAGDVTNLSYKQVMSTGGEGIKAALRSYQYLQKKIGAPVIPDWT